MFRVKKDDPVVVLSGKDRGKRGKILHVFPTEDRVIVEGLGLVKRHMRKSRDNPQGAVVAKEGRLSVSRVMPVCPRCNRGVRVGFKFLEDGSKSRICRRCKENF